MDKFNLTDYLADFNEEEESDVVLTCPYRMEKFRQWLISNEGYTEPYADAYINNYISAYEKLYDVLHIDLYALLNAILEIYKGEDTEILEIAIELVDSYVQTMDEIMDKAPDTFSKAEQRAMVAYRDFIASVSGVPDPVMLKPKTLSLPDEAGFVVWLEKSLRMYYLNAMKVLSSVKNTSRVLTTLLKLDNPLTEMARDMRDKHERDALLADISERARTRLSGGRDKTLRNGLSNLKLYFSYLNDTDARARNESADV